MSVDGEKLMQYQSQTKPSEGDEPKYVVMLVGCVIEELQVRKFCFKVTDSTTDTELVFAADNFSQYENWLKFLILRNKRGGEVQHITANTTTASIAAGFTGRVLKQPEGSVMSTDLSSAFEQQQDDFVFDFFHQNNISKVRPHCPC